MAIRQESVKYIVYVLCVLLFQFFSQNAFATSKSPGIVTRYTPGIGGGGGEVNGSGTIMPNLFTGSMQYSIPINVPLGRKGMQPKIALTYRSNRGGNGWIGMGWDLEVVAIERSTLNGVDLDGDSYVLRLAGSAIDLVDIGNNQYRAKIDNGFYKIVKLADSHNRPYWQVTDKTGKWYRFGSDTTTRQDDPGDPSLNKPANEDHIFKWCLEHEEDTNGNYIDYIYTKQVNGQPYQGQIYLSQINYTGNSLTQTAFTNYIKFNLGPRSDAPDMFSTNFKVVTAWRLISIDVWGNGNRMGAYRLAYGYSGGTSRSILTNVQQYGKDANIDSGGEITSGTALPATLFGWRQGNYAFDSGMSENFDANNSFRNLLVADVNGDGITDLIYQPDGSANSTCGPGIVGVYLGNGDGTFQPIKCTGIDANREYRILLAADLNGDGKADLIYQPDGSANSTCGPGIVGVYLGNGDGTFQQIICSGWEANRDDRNLIVADVNGDGFLDLIYQPDGSPNGACGQGIVGVHISNGDGTFQPIKCTGWEANREYRNLLAADVNGDGRADLIYQPDGSPNGTCGPGIVGVHIATGDTSSGPSMFESIKCTGWEANREYRNLLPADVNGDGRADLIYQPDGSPNGACGQGIVGVHIATGDTSSGPGMFEPIKCTGIDANKEYRNLLPADVNGDGRADLIYQPDGSVYNTCGIGIVGVYRSNGDGTFNLYCTTFEANRTRRNLFVADVNGDGKTDLIYQPDGSSSSAFGAGIVGVYLASQPAADLMWYTSNGLGGTTSVSYTPSTKYVNTLLPFVLQTLSAVTTNDGNGVQSTTAYTYSGGYYSISERDFRGFNYVKVSGPGPQGVQKITETWYHQGNDITVDANNPAGADGFMKGKPYRTRVSDAFGAIYSEVTTAYGADSITSPPYFAPPHLIDAYTCDGKLGSSCSGNPSAWHIETKYTYDDATGNVIREDHYGDVNDPNPTAHSFTTIRSYATNTNAGAWILDRPETETVYRDANHAPDDSHMVSQTSYFYDYATTHQTAPTIGNLTRVVRLYKEKSTFGGTDPVTDMTYDDYGNLLSTTDPMRNTNTVAYDSTNTFPTLVTVATNSFHFQTTTQYYGVNGVPADNGLYGQVKSITDPNNVTTSRQYDVFGRKTNVTMPDVSWTSWSYQNFGSVGSQNVRVDTAAGLSSWTYFDGFGRTFLAKKSGPNSSKIDVQTQYNPTGTVASQSLPYFDGTETPRWNTFTYDPLGRTLQATSPDGTASFCYFKGATGYFDRENHLKRQVRDDKGNLVEVDEYLDVQSCSTALGSPYAKTYYDYDALGRLVTVTDAELHHTTMAYDTLGRRYSMNDPDMGIWAYRYDSNGNLTSQIDAKNQTIVFTYDALNRLKKKDYPTGTDVTYTYDESFSTYPKGRLTTMTDASGTTKYYYDKMGRGTSTSRTIDGTTHVSGASYDLAGRIKTIVYPDETINYNYDNGGNLSSVYAGSTTYVSYTNYNAFGQPGSATYGNGVVTGYGYSSTDNRLISLTTGKGSQQLQFLTYSYYPEGNIQIITDHLNSSRSQNFIYDDLYRLIQAQSNADGAQFFAYDQIGNITSKPRDVQTNSYGPWTWHFCYGGSCLSGANDTCNGDNVGAFTCSSGVMTCTDAADFYWDDDDIGYWWQLRTVTCGGMSNNTYSYAGPRPHAVTSTTDGATYHYDDNGNMYSDGTRTITYNYDNMPTSVTINGVTTSFVYDGSGARVKKITPSGVTTTYIGGLYECNAGNCSKYIFAGSKRIARKSGTNVDYYHGDHLGSTSVVTNSPAGASEGTIYYYPFGATSAGDVPASHKYTSQEFDAETGLYYYNARYYNPKLGKFISPDTIVPNPGNPQALNRYSYATNNPVNFTDPSGHWRISISAHYFGGADLSYDFSNGTFRAGVGAGMGGGLSVGNSNWDIGASHEYYADYGYDSKLGSNYISGKYGNGVQMGGAMYGAGASGTYYTKFQAYQVSAGGGFGYTGANIGYSSFGGGSWSLGGSYAGIGATNDFGSHSWHYSVNPVVSNEYYKSTTTYTPTLKPGKPLPGKNSSYYNPDRTGGIPPSDENGVPYNVFGLNRSLSGNCFLNFFTQGQALSVAANAIGGNSIGVLHDVWVNRVGDAMSIPLMIPAAIVSGSALLGNIWPQFTH